MIYDAKVIRVFIIASNDKQIERALIRKRIDEWNKRSKQYCGGDTWIGMCLFLQ